MNKYQWRQADSDDWKDIEGVNPYDAVTQAAEMWDQEDYHLVRTNYIVIFSIRDCITNEIMRFSVHAESLPYYYAYKIKDDDR